MKYIVYKTTCKVNNKIYIGVHKCNPDIFDGYIGCGVTKSNYRSLHQTKFHNAVNKYGYGNFIRETLFEFEDSYDGMINAYNKEKELVDEQFLKRDDVYNMSVGGISPQVKTSPVIQYSIEGDFIKIWDSIIDAEVNLNLTSISQAASGKSKYCGNYQWRYFTKEQYDLHINPVEIKEKTIYQFSLNGELIKVWKNASLACKEFENSKSARVAINNVCNGITRQAYGYYWSYKSKFEYNPYNKCTAVACYNDNGEFLQSFTSLKEAKEYFNLKTSNNIISAIKGTQLHCAGVRWRYFYGDKNNIKPIK